jgi:hypothetical protein
VPLISSKTSDVEKKILQTKIMILKAKHNPKSIDRKTF